MNRVFVANLALLGGGILLALWSINLNSMPVSTTSNIVSNSLGLFYVLGPVLGFIGAKEMGRFKDFLGACPSGRIVGRIAFRSLGYVVGLGILMPLAYLLAGLSTVPIIDLSLDLLMGVVTIGLQAATWSAFGAVLGLYLPTVVAAALGLFVPFVFAAYPVSMSNVAWRQMFGQPYTSCCSVSQEIDPILWQSTAWVLGSVLASALILLFTFRGTKKFALYAKIFAVLILGFCLSAGYSVGAKGNYNSAVLRSAESMLCEKDICAWPETPEAQRAVNTRIWRSLGIHGYRLVDSEVANNEEDILFPRTADENEAKKIILTQLLSHEPELKNTDSCWDSENGKLSLAEALPDMGLNDLDTVLLTPSGKWRGLHGTNDGVDVRAIADRVNRECQGR